MSIETDSPWLSEVPPHVTFPSVEENLDTAVAIVGGGIAGLVTAYELSKRGVAVTVLEKGTIGAGETGYTTAFLTHIVDLGLVELSQRLGSSAAQSIWQAGAQAIQSVGDISRQEDIACDYFPCPALIYTSQAEDQTHLQAEAERAREMGFTVDWVQPQEQQLIFPNQGYLQVSNQAKFHPRKFILGLSQAILRHGGQIFEKTGVKKIQPGNVCELTTKTGTVRASTVVMCTNFPQLLPSLLPKVHPFQTYAIQAQLPPQILPEALFWDTLHPYHYFRIDRFPGADRLILGGEDHSPDHPPSQPPHAALETFLRNLLPQVPAQVIRHWGGQILETQDGLPLIGQVDSNHPVYVATGFSGNGMTYGVIAGQLLAAVITTGEHPWKNLFDPQRAPHS